MNKLIGTWELVEWDCTIDGGYHSHPFGRDAQGMLQYTAEGQMAAVLMRRERPLFTVPNLAAGTDDEKLAAVSGYVSYGGSFHVAGGQVIHSVRYSLLPNWIDTNLVRNVNWTNDDLAQLILTTVPTTTSSGRVVINRLRWARVVK